MTSPGFFDGPVIALLEEMVGDLSFALDHLDRVETLRRAQQALQEQQQQLSGLVETAMDAIITVDARQTVRLFNRAASEMFGMAPNEAIGGALERFVPLRLRAMHGAHFERFAVRGNTARRMGALQTLVGLRSNGDEFPIEASISKWGSGEQALMTVVVRDATELRRAEQERLKSVSAESANRAKSEFRSRMSHELRTPLNAIIGFSQLLRSDDSQSLSPAQAAQVEYIHQAGWHLLALVTDVLDVSRIEAGRLRVDPVVMEGFAVLEDAAQMVRGMATQQGLTLQVEDRSDGHSHLVADRTRLQQVLIDLLSNALKYNRPAGRVDAVVSRAGNQLCFRISDTGPGMTEEQLEHLYEPFNRLGREQGRVEGTALGLALTRQLVTLMNGTLVVRSTLGAGTEVDVCLPACDAEIDPAVTGPAASPAVREPEGTVLYIEDNPVNRLLVEQLLARWPKVHLLQAEDGRSGVDLARSARPAVVLLDMHLPDMDGFNVLRLLESARRHGTMRVIALSADAMPEQREAALQAGADDYWTKPFDFGQFLSGLARALAPKEDGLAVEEHGGRDEAG